MQRSSVIGFIAGGFAVMLLTPAVASAAQSIFVNNTAADPVPTFAVGTTQVAGAVDASGSTVQIGNDAGSPVPVMMAKEGAVEEEWEALATVAFQGGSAFGNATIDVPEDMAITVTRASASDFFGLQVISFGLIELCDFTDGKNGLGGFAFVPIGVPIDADEQGIDHATNLHLTEGSCLELTLRLDTPLGGGGSGSMTVSLSGTSRQVPVAARTAESRDDALMRSLDDSLLRGIMSDDELAAARAQAGAG